MKILSLVRLAIATAILTASAQAAGPAGKRFGGFAPKQTMTFKVEDRQSFETQGSATVPTFRIPAAIPRFNVGQTVKLTIGGKGQLKGPGFSFALEQDGADYNQYLAATTPKKATPNSALLTKAAPGAAQQVVLYFYDENLTGPDSSVTYLLK
jgi:hypothetical protein